MLDHSLIPLTFVGGPAILANARAILQNGANMRYGHAVDQWRTFQTSLAEEDGKLARLYSDPSAVVRLSEKRLQPQPRELDFLVAGACLFGVACVLALVWSVLSQIQSVASPVAAVAMLVSGALGLAALVAVVATILQETRCTRTLMGRHLQRDSGARV
ncbi:hypothetical protein [Paraburkholderia silvatlantica]|uniref:DUF2721 domain-containing protein n=1 Tax=Paraburkholderia silvatlantica TaxID=321895 RepID=A0ABR6FXU4_9BURK|nr:hypothetical protein [Paraburkholderia silvatlantica]MBB2931937.1 hypothetical protein [Paraburkholderia silvatlantica]PVY24615.1 hypothetical protein C7411_1274 [Paraburkholderia silvatlantica]PXW31111.1 hypothetical protein C7413_1264 [Paraburkholderia silvatlantica]